MKETIIIISEHGIEWFEDGMYQWFKSSLEPDVMIQRQLDRRLKLLPKKLDYENNDSKDK